MTPGTETPARAPLRSSSRARMRLGEILVGSGIASVEQIDHALAVQRMQPCKRLGEILIASGVLTEGELARTLAEEFKLPYVDLTVHPRSSAAMAAVPPHLVLKYRVLPLEVGDDGITVALADPLDLNAIESVRFAIQRPIREVIATASQIDSAIAELLPATDVGTTRTTAHDVESILDEIAKEKRPETSATSAELHLNEGSSSIIRLVNQILVDAYRTNASDIHIEPNGNRGPGVVRFRVDGECRLYHELPVGLAAPVTARIKIMADLDIAERRKPQDGKIAFHLGSETLELRVASLPTIGGNEDLVLRLLPPAIPKRLAQLDLSPKNLAALANVLKSPYGLFLCVGPTGSGKTTTLHSALGELNKSDTKIWTAEDPVEIAQPGLRQVQINRKAGLDFATAMRAFLRADPDIIMVGEMRDLETATIAVEASLTGHLVLSTLHTNSAPETVLRLLDMGLDRFGFADSLVGILAQRLVRRLCVSCRERRPSTASEHELLRALAATEGTTGDEDRLGEWSWHGRGCDRCSGTGYAGRIAIHELLVVDQELRALIAGSPHIDAIRALAASQGMATLLEDGIAKAGAGLTDLPQVLAACKR